MTEIDTAKCHQHPKLSMLRYDRHRLLASATLQRVLRAAAKYSICTVCSRNTLKQWYQIHQLSIGHIVKPRRHRYLQDTSTFAAL